MARTIALDFGYEFPNDGEGITVQDLADLLYKLPAKTRRNCYPTIVTEDGVQCEIIGIKVGQSDQAEEHEYKISLALDKRVRS